MGFSSSLGNERGVALPMALIMLLLLTALMVAFAALSQTEPVIANNQLRTTQARMMAEAGVERAMWALTNPTDKSGLGVDWEAVVKNGEKTAPAPYDGSQLMRVSPLGGFVLTLTSTTATDVNVTSTGRMTRDKDDDLKATPLAHRVVSVTLVNLTDLPLKAPCALCVRGDLQVGGNATVSGADDGCGAKYGTFSKGDAKIVAGGTVASPIDKTGGKNVDGTLDPAGVGDFLKNQTGKKEVQFDDFKLSESQLQRLKEMAMQNGSYYRPDAKGGTLTFDGSSKEKSLKNSGVIFIDTHDGRNPTDTTPAGGFPRLEIKGDKPFFDPETKSPTSEFQGWIVVNGNVVFSSDSKINGMLYAVNDLFAESGPAAKGEIQGLAIAQNLNTEKKAILAPPLGPLPDTTVGKSIRVTFNCEKARSATLIPINRWSVLAGSYREVSD